MPHLPAPTAGKGELAAKLSGNYAGAFFLDRPRLTLATDAATPLRMCRTQKGRQPKPDALSLTRNSGYFTAKKNPL